MKAVIHIFLSFAFFLLLNNVIAQALSQNRRVDWGVAGLKQNQPFYSNMVNINNFGGNGNGIAANDAAFNAALASLGNDSGTIYFPAGTYVFLSPIALRSGLVLRGENAALSTLQFNLSGINDLITIAGNSTSIKNSLTASAYKNDQSIVVNNASLFAVGDYIKLSQNDSSLVYDIFNCVGQILCIKSISGDTIKFNNPLRRTYKLSDSPRLQKFSMISASGLECLKIKRLDATNSQQANINFNYAARCWLKGIESDSANFAHVTISSSTNIEITGSYFHGSFVYGTGGQGYGIALNKTTGECLIENNIFRRLRHSMLIQSGANGNVFSYNYSREPYKSESAPSDLAGDIVLHGNYPYANLFEGNIVQNIVFDTSHKINGSFNTFLRNRAELYGLLFTTGSGDSTNIVGNEITGNGLFQGNYIVAGLGNFEYGNNVKGSIKPIGTTGTPDNSYYYNTVPSFWTFSSQWPSMGSPNPYNTISIPAKARYESGTNLTVCPPNNLLSSSAISLYAHRKEAAVILKWQTNDFRNTKQYEVERSSDGQSFSFLKLLRYPTPQTLFEFTDYSPKNGSDYYRVSSMSATNERVYSNIVKVSSPNGNSNILKIFPNPANQRLNIYIDKIIGPMQVSIKNTLGHILKQYHNVRSDRGLISLEINALNSGIYYVEVSDSIGIKKGKFIKSK